jgi:hypothetical protein
MPSIPGRMLKREGRLLRGDVCSKRVVEAICRSMDIVSRLTCNERTGVSSRHLLHGHLIANSSGRSGVSAVVYAGPERVAQDFDIATSHKACEAGFE